jgi:hypothetical protein
MEKHSAHPNPSAYDSSIVSTISKSCVLYDDVRKLSFVYGFFGESLLFSKLVLWVSCGNRGVGWSGTSDAHFWECDGGGENFGEENLGSFGGEAAEFVGESQVIDEN